MRALALTLAVVVMFVAPDARAESAATRAEIRALQQRQADAWNAHDARAYAALFVEDGDVVNVLGWWWRGRAEIERNLRQAFAVTFAQSRLTITETAVRELGADLAVAHVRWSMAGAKAPPGAAEPPSQGIQLQVLRREAGQWRIVSFQNTNSVPEAAFPAAPPPSGAAEPARGKPAT
jgi:uncharacterized protein (TIGR02246 family)